MNFIKKLDIFLLEKFPLLWHTKLVYACLFSILMSILFYSWGYFYTDSQSIIRISQSYYFERSNASLCLVILNAIFIIGWALAFYRKNAVKNLYPLQRFYFSRLLCSFMVIFWSLTWPYTTFNWGVKAKVKQLAPMEELKDHIQTINFADAFFFDNSFSYTTYLNVYHPDVKEVQFDYNDSTWTNMPSILYSNLSKLKESENQYKFKDHEENRFTESELKNQETLYNPSHHPENNDTIENMLTQFLAIKTTIAKSACSSSGEYTYLIDAKKLKQLCPYGLHDLRNFSKEKLPSDYFSYPEYKSIFHEYASGRNNYRYLIHYDEYISDHNFSVEANKSFNAFLTSSERNDMLKVLDKYQALLIRHEIRHSLDNAEILDYVLKRKYKMPAEAVVDNHANNPEKAQADLSKFGGLEEYEAFRASTEDENEQSLYFVEQAQLEELYSNSQIAHDPSIHWIPFIFSLFFALGFALVFFLFAIGNPINLIIAASVGGVFVILNVLFFIVFLEYHGSDIDDYRNVEFRLFAQLLIFSAILYTLLYIFYKGKGISKRLLLITFNLCFAVTILLPMFVYQFLETLLRKEYIDKCNDSHIEHSIFHYWVQDPLIIWLSVFGAILVFTHLIKPVLAKPE